MSSPEQQPQQPVGKQAVPCPVPLGGCGNRMYVPGFFQNFILNCPTTSVLVLSHENPVRCSKCHKWWTVGLSPGIDLSQHIGLMPSPAPPEQSDIVIEREMPKITLAH